MPVLTPAEIREQAGGWVVHYESFWALEELCRILDNEGPNRTWSIVLMLLERASDDALASVGAGILEKLLGEHGPAVTIRLKSI